MVKWIALLGVGLMLGGAAKSGSASGAGLEQAVEPTKLTLSCRTDNGAYGSAAYSFKWRSSDVNVHHNAVDLLYERCGLVHVNTYGGCQNQVIDLGKKSLEKVRRLPTRGWNLESFRPIAGHSYLLRVAEEEVEKSDTKEVRTLYKMAIKFKVLSVTTKAVEIEWLPLDGKQAWTQPKRTGGRIGTKGQCGGVHRGR